MIIVLLLKEVVVYAMIAMAALILLRAVFSLTQDIANVTQFVGNYFM